MRRRQNIIIFSAGESVRNGIVSYLCRELTARDMACFDWRDLFAGAHDLQQIALLPALSKKIPTFDFALIVAEGVDKVKLRGEEEYAVMRDNVIFELGLCIMALGVERVILLAEESVRIPEDLTGIGQIGVAYIPFSAKRMNAAVSAIGTLIESRADEPALQQQLDRIAEHVRTNADLISPVFIGAAVASAEAYFLNFIVRLLEHVDRGFSPQDEPQTLFVFPEKFEIKVILPTKVDSLTRAEIAEFYAKNGYRAFAVREAGTRGLFFYGRYTDGRLTVVDIPTSVTASYALVHSVLNIESDDDYDNAAQERFAAKEMDIYAYALKKLLCRDVASERLSFLHEKKERILQALCGVSICSVEMG